MERSDAKQLTEFSDHDTWSSVWAHNMNDYKPDDEVDGAEDAFESAVYPRFGADTRRKDYGIQLFDDRITGGSLRGRHVDADNDMTVVKGLMEGCNLLHEHGCNNRLYFLLLSSF